MEIRNKLYNKSRMKERTDYCQTENRKSTELQNKAIYNLKDQAIRYEASFSRMVQHLLYYFLNSGSGTPSD